MEIIERTPIRLKLKDLKWDEANPNEMNEAQMDALRESMKKFGYLVPIIVDQDNLVADGEHRARIYLEFGREEIDAYRIKFENDLDRKMLRQTMNKLRGHHDPYKDAIELGEFFKADNLEDVRKLIAEDTNVLKRLIAEYHPDQSLLSFHKDLAEGVATGFGSLSKNWGIPPFSVLDRRTQTWQNRKREWLEFGIASEAGRENVVLYDTHINVRVAPMKDGRPNKNYLPTVSVFDPVLAEVSLRWFCNPNSKILDPFSGGSVRGIVSSYLGHDYTGIDLRKEQIDANEKQYEVLRERMPDGHLKPIWITGDSKDLDQLLPDKEEKFDFLLTSPPYFQVEKYSNNENDLNNMTWEQFSNVYTEIISKSAKKLKENSFVCWNVGNARDRKHGFYVNQNDLTKTAFEKEGFRLHNELIVVHSSYSLAFRVNNMFIPKRVVPKQHEFLLVFYNGDRDSITRVDPQIVNIPEIAESEGESESELKKEEIIED